MSEGEEIKGRPKTNVYNWFIVPTIFLTLGLLGYVIYKQAKENSINA